MTNINHVLLSLVPVLLIYDLSLLSLVPVSLIYGPVLLSFGPFLGPPTCLIPMVSPEPRFSHNQVQNGQN